MLNSKAVLAAICAQFGEYHMEAPEKNWGINHHKGKGRNKSPHKFTGVLKVKRLAKKLKNKNR